MTEYVYVAQAHYDHEGSEFIGVGRTITVIKAEVTAWRQAKGYATALQWKRERDSQGHETDDQWAQRPKGEFYPDDYSIEKVKLLG